LWEGGYVPEDAIELEEEVDVGHRRYNRQYVGEGYEVMPAFIGQKVRFKGNSVGSTRLRTLSMRAASSANTYNMSFIDVLAVTGFIEASCIVGGVMRDIVGKSMRHSPAYCPR
jgi:hypothetical protein